MQANNHHVIQKAQIIELVGPAGSGKTTLVQALSQRNRNVKIGSSPEIKKIEHLPVFVQNTPNIMPILLQRKFAWDEMKSMIYLKGWSRILRQQAGSLVILDHGPIFRFAKLLVNSHENLRKQDCDKWWSSLLAQWRKTLDFIVWLDAPDAILKERIDARNQSHKVKGRTQPEADEFLMLYRTYYLKIIEKMCSNGGPKLREFNTHQTSIEQITEEILAVSHSNQMDAEDKVFGY